MTRGGPLAILVAEDEPVVRKVLAALLQRRGVTVTAVADGREALDALSRLRFDLAILDLRMPGLDGMETLRAVRALPDPLRARLPVAILTANAMPGEAVEARAAGADLVLEKPLRWEDLAPHLERLRAGTAMHGDVPPPAAPDARPTPPFDRAAIADMDALLPSARVAVLLDGAARALVRHGVDLERAAAEDDRDALGALAHRIAGVAGAYGCRELSRRARVLERTADAGGDCRTAAAAVGAALEPALEFLAAPRAAGPDG